MVLLACSQKGNTKGGGDMTDIKMLDATIEDSGFSYGYLAEALGLSRQGFYKKRIGLTEFTASEVVKLSEILNLPREKRDKIFLT